MAVDDPSGALAGGQQRLSPLEKTQGQALEFDHQRAVQDGFVEPPQLGEVVQPPGP